MTHVAKFLVLLIVAFSPAAVLAQQIHWEVKQPFRFIEPKSQTSTSFAISSKESAYDFITERLASRDRSKLPPIYDTRAVDSEGKYEKEYIFPRSQRVTARLNSAPPGICKWRYLEQTGLIECSEQFEFDAIVQLDDSKLVEAPRLTISMSVEEREIASIEVVVRDRLILGLGDSVASGEGNPDIPTLVSSDGVTRLADANKERITNGRWMKNASRIWVNTEAKWLNAQCHRSMFSQHVLTAMRLASVNPQESITLLPLGCSGAEILDGLLVPQKDPPGTAKGNRVSDSQLNIALKNLCRTSGLSSVTKIFHKGSSGDYRLQPVSQTVLRCSNEHLRKPDVILLSVGGNDIGFSRVIAWAGIPNGHTNPFGFIGVGLTQLVVKPICPTQNWNNQRRCHKNKPVASYRVESWLPLYYQLLADELNQTGLVSDPKKVHLTAYPNPLFTENGTLCDYERSEDANEQIRTTLYSFLFPRKWRLGLTPDESRDINDGLIEPLRNQMQVAANKLGWQFIDAHVSKMKLNGLCAGYERTDCEMIRGEKKCKVAYPHIRRGEWHPNRPDQIWAYDRDRDRWWRNTNDSYLFQSDTTDEIDDIYGAFHPDFRAHATMADELFNVIRPTW